MIEKDYFSNLKYSAIYNLLRFNNIKFSKTNISLIVHNMYVDIQEKIDASSIRIIKNVNEAMDTFYQYFESKSKICDTFVKKLVQLLMGETQITEYDFNNPKYLKFSDDFNKLKWQQISVFDFNINLAQVFLLIIRDTVFDNYSFETAYLLCFLLPLAQKMHPIVIKFNDEKKLNMLIANNAVDDLSAWFKSFQEESERVLEGLLRVM